MTDPARIQRIAAAVHECAVSWDPGARLIGNVTADEIRELAIAASEAVAPVELVSDVEWYPYPHDTNRHYASLDAPLEIEVYQTQAVAPLWYWDVTVGGTYSITGGVADTIDAAKAAAIAAARAWRDSIRL